MAGWIVEDNPGVKLAGQLTLIALVIGTSLSAASTERADATLVLWTMLGWSVVPALQLLTGCVLVAARRRLGLAAALECYFGTHVAWSLWILGVHALFVVLAPARDAALWVAVSAVIPAGLTARRLFVVCRDQLAMPATVAMRQLALHQSISYGLLLAYIDFAVALRARVGW